MDSDSSLNTTPTMKSPPRTTPCLDKSRSIMMMENESPNATFYEEGSIGDTPTYPSPAQTTPFYSKTAGRFNDSYTVLDSSVAKWSKGNQSVVSPQFTCLNACLPPTPECTEAPQSVRILRHRSHFNHSHKNVSAEDSPESNQQVQKKRKKNKNSVDHSQKDESLGATPALTSPPISVALITISNDTLRKEVLSKSTFMTTPLNRNTRCAIPSREILTTPVSSAIPSSQQYVPDSAFDPKYQKGFEDEVLNVSSRSDFSFSEDEGYEDVIEFEEGLEDGEGEESWLVSQEVNESFEEGNLENIKLAQEELVEEYESLKKDLEEVSKAKEKKDEPLLEKEEECEKEREEMVEENIVVEETKKEEPKSASLPAPRWTPKPEEEKSWPDEVVLVPIPHVTPRSVLAKKAPRIIKPTITYVIMSTFSESFSRIKTTKDIETVSKSIVKPANPITKVDAKTRMKTIHGIFVRKAGKALSIEEVIAELKEEMTNQEVLKTLNSLVNLKLLQKMDDKWSVKTNKK